MAEVKDYFVINNPAGVVWVLSEPNLEFTDPEVHEVRRGGPPGFTQPLPSNDVFASSDNLRFAVGSAAQSTGSVRFVGNHGQAVLTLADFGATSTFEVATIRFVRYPYAEALSPGSVQNGNLLSGGPDWLQPLTACRLNTEAADMILKADFTFDALAGNFNATSLHGLGFWSTGQGSIKQHPVPSAGLPAPVELTADPKLILRGTTAIHGPVFFQPIPQIGPLGGLKLPVIDYSTVTDPSWLIGTIGWVVNVPGQPATESWFAVKVGATPQAQWMYLSLQ